MTKQEEALALHEAEIRNPQIDFRGEKNLAVQTGYKTIAQEISDFERAGRAIMVANADAHYPEMAGLPAYPDPIEAELLRREVDAELLIARKRLLEDQEAAFKAAEDRARKNEEELTRIKAIQKDLEEKAMKDKPVI